MHPLRSTSAVLLSTTATLFAQSPSFSDQTTAAGISSVHSPNYQAGFAAGGAVGDFNRDGFPDIYHPVGGGQPDRLYINDGDGTFTERASQWGIALSHRGTGAVVGDFNGDGWVDLFVTSLGPANSDAPGNHILYRNDGGTGFTNVAGQMNVNSTGSAPDGWGGAFGDYDLDGDLDLAVAAWRTGSSNRLFRNDGNTFTDVTVSSGISGSLSNISGFAPKFVDMDGDRYPEIIWIGDFSTSKYFVNDGDGTFTDRTVMSNTADDGTEMGVTITDINEDGLFDIYVTTIQTNNLYINQGNHVFQNVASSAGVTNSGWGWGAVSVDINHDTLVDLIATSQSSRQYVFLNQSSPPSSLSFSEVGAASGLVSTRSGRGLSNLDIDNDGDQDIVIFPSNAGVQLFRNDLTPATNTHWLRVLLDDGCAPGIPTDGIGAIVRASVGSRTWSRFIDAGSNYLSNSEPSAHFGLGTSTTVDTLTIEWPDGQVTNLTNVAADQTLTVRADSTVSCVSPIGAGCAGSGGVPALTPQPGSTAALGTTLNMNLTGLNAAGAPAALFIALNRSNPGIDLSLIGLAGCRLYPTGPALTTIPLTNTSGTATWSLPIGTSPAVAGLELVMQALTADPGGPSGGAALSNAMRSVVR